MMEQCTRQSFSAWAALPVLALLMACGGGSATSSAPQKVTVSINPGSAVVEPSSPKAFFATVGGSANPAVTWSVQEGISGGSIDGSGNYMAPSQTPGTVSTFHILATLLADPTVTGTAVVTVKTLPVVVVSPATSSLLLGGTKTFTAAVTFAQNPAVTWTVQEPTGGSVTQGGVYTAPATIPGSTATYHVVATSQEDPSRKATAEITVQLPLTLSLTPANVVVEPGYPQMFTATEAGTGNLLAVSWSIQEGGSGGTITNSSPGKGLYVAPNLAPGSTATYHLVATSADGQAQAVATVTVKTLPKVMVTPATVHLAVGAVQAFSVTVTFAQNPAVTWSVQESQGGSITQAGVYTAPATIPGIIATYHVVATSVEDPSRSAASEVTLQDGATVGAWSAVGNTLEARGSGGFAVALVDGRVLYGGGWNGTQPAVSNILGNAELYDPATQAFAATGPLLVPRLGAAGILLSDGRVLVVGGQTTGSSSWLKTTELFDPVSGTFSAGPTLQVANYRPQLGLLASGEVLVSAPGTGKMEILNVTTNSSSGPWDGAVARQNFGTAMLPDGRMLMAGGSWGGVYSQHAEIFDPATKISTPVGDLSVARQLPNLVTLPSGKVLVMGGTSVEAGVAIAYATVELFDPATGTFLLQTPMSVPRVSPQTVLLPNGKVLVTGGYSYLSMGNTAASEIFDPASGTFEPTGSAITPRSYGFLLRLKDGSLLCFGGYDSVGYSVAAERYQ